MNKTIQLTEADIHKLVEESVQDILMNEGMWDKLKGGANAAKSIFKNGGVGQAARNNYQGMKNNVMNGSVGEIGQNIKQGFKNFGQGLRASGKAISMGAQNAEGKAVINNAIQALEKVSQLNPSILGKSGSTTQIMIRNLINALTLTNRRFNSSTSAFVNNAKDKMGINRA